MRLPSNFSPIVKLTLLAGFLLVSLLAVVIYLRPTSLSSASVEQQIGKFGPRLTLSLGSQCAFASRDGGYAAQPESLQPPPGLKPLEQKAWLAMAARFPDQGPLAITFPERYSARTRVRSQGMDIGLQPLGSQPAAGHIENGKLVYRDAYASTDSLNVVHDGRSEEFLLLRNSSAPQRFDYSISTAGVRNISLRDNSVYFANDKGQQVQIEAPWLVESGGHAVAGAVHWELAQNAGPNQAQLSLVVSDAAHLTYPVVIDPSWVVTNRPMNTAREFHTATLLTSGLVLVAGGETASSTATASAELYDPTTGTWTATASLATARYAHTATLLQNGTVLVTGGYDGTNNLASSEIFNPATATWSSTGNLNMARSEPTATLLTNGQVLEVGGDGQQFLTSCELYNPSTGTWSTTGSTHYSRFLGTVTLLASGQVLAVGGYTSPQTAEFFNPSTASWTVTANAPIYGRYFHCATLLQTGSVLIASGYGTAASTDLAPAELYNPSNQSFSTTGSISTPREFAQMALLQNGTVLLAGGIVSSGQETTTVELYTPSTGTWTQAPSITFGREDFTLTMLQTNQLLAAGGYASSGVTSSSELYNVAVGTFQPGPTLNTARTQFTATLLPNGQVLVAGGLTGSGAVTNTAELYNPATTTWTTTGNLNVARFEHTATLLPNGQVLVAGGLSYSVTSTPTAELYNVANGTWTLTGSLANARYSHNAVLLPTGKVLVAAGTTNSNYASAVAPAELYNPASGTWANTGSLITPRTDSTATLLPNSLVLFIGGYDATGNETASSETYNIPSGTFSATHALNTARAYHTATLLHDGLVLVAGGLGTNSALLTSCELYSSASGRFAATGSLNYARVQHTATILRRGVVVAAGSSYSSTATTAELYDPATGLWQVTGSLATGRYAQGATILPDGHILMEGGQNLNSYDLASTENYNPGLGSINTTEPVLNTVTTANSTTALNLTGMRFTGTSEGSSGNFQNSSSNYPIVQLQSLVNDEAINVTLDPSHPFTATSFTSLPPTGFVPGYALLTVLANGTPSNAQIVNYSLAAQTISNFPASQNLSQSSSPYTLPATTSAGLAITYYVSSGPATISGNVLTFTGNGTVVLVAGQAGNGTYAPTSYTDTITVAAAAPAVATDTPTMPVWGLALLGLLLCVAAGQFAGLKPRSEPS